MTGGAEELCLRLLDLARKQKAALEAEDLDEVVALAGTRQRILREIQKIDGFPGAPGKDGKPAPALSLIRQVLSIDEEAGGIARTLKQGISKKISEINTIKVCYQGAVDGARLRGAVPGP